MPEKDYVNLTDKDFEGLPPLVPEGEDRKAILDEVVRQWVELSASLDSIDRHLPADFIVIESSPATLKRIDLRDANPGAKPIDLGELLRKVAEQLNDEDMSAEPPSSRSVIPLLGCRIRVCRANQLKLPARILTIGCRFNEADFRNTSFSGDVDFSNASFSSDVDFCRASFDEGAIFKYASFCGKALFRKASFSYDADFYGASFSGSADFRSTNIAGGSDFQKTSFGGEAYFHYASFSYEVDFSNAYFSDNVYFRKSIFNDGVLFYEATFCGDAGFRDVIFNDYADFNNVSFKGELIFRPNHLSRSVSMAECRLAETCLGLSDLRRVRMADAAWHPHRLSWWEDCRKRIVDRLHWSQVRSIGRLQILTRVSYAALLLVPLIAGAWPGVQALARRYHVTLREAADALQAATDRAQQAGMNLPPDKLEAIRETLTAVDKLIAETPYLPFSWLLLFMAALAVALGHLAYQLLAPQLVQQRSADDLVGAANELNRVDGKITDERLRQAIDHIRTAGEALPHRRSPWLVTRNRRTVWLPHDLELYKPAQVPVPDDQRTDDIPENATLSDIDAQDEEVSSEDRKRIAIEEGEKARYEVEVFERRQAAWLSGGLYLLGGWYLLIIIVAQFANIADAAGMASARQFVHPYRHAAAGWGTVVLLAFMLVGIVLAWDGLWEWFAGFTKRLRRSKRDDRAPR